MDSDRDPPPPLLRIQTTIVPNTSGTTSTPQNSIAGLGSRPSRTRSPPLISLSSTNSSNSNSPAHSSSNGGCTTHPHLSPDIVSAGKGGSRGGSRAGHSLSSTSDSDSFDEPEARIPRYKGFDDDDDDSGSEREDRNSSSDEELESDAFDDKEHEERMKRLNWTTTDLALLYKILVLNGKRPVGINKHFTMMSVRSRFAAEARKNISSDAIWNHLRTLYNLKELEEYDNPDDSPWLANHEFILPGDFSDMTQQFLNTGRNAANTSGTSSSTPKVPHPPAKRTTGMGLDDEDVDMANLGLGSSGLIPSKKTKP